MIRGILFDLDGTLVDSNELNLQSFQYTIQFHLHQMFSSEHFIKTFGRPLADVMEEFSPGNKEALLKTYRSYSAAHHDELIRLCPLVRETLIQLKNRQIKTAIVTSKIKSVAEHNLDFFHLLDYFDVLITPEVTSAHKPNPEPALKALELLQLAPDEAIMVGDSPYDLLCGKNAGTKTAAVRYSVFPMEALLKCQPNDMLDTIFDLIHIIDSELDAKNFT